MSSTDLLKFLGWRSDNGTALFLTLNHLWTAAPFFLALLKGFIFPLPLLDFWWHLKMGQVILEKLSIPRTDIFSFTAAGKIFVVQNWLAEVLFYLTYRAGGFQLLVFFNGMLLILVLLPIFVLCRRLSKGIAATIFPVSLIAVCIPGNLRPQVFSFVLFSIFCWCLLSTERRTHYRFWIMPALMVLWVNLHGGFVVGLALITIYLVCESIRSLFSRPPDALSRDQIASLALVLILCISATLANPEGYKIYEYIRTVVDDPSSRQFVAEWQPPSISRVDGVLQFFLPFFILTLVLIVTRQRPNLTEIGLYAAFSVFGLMAARNSVWFLLIAAPILARHIPQVDWKELLRFRKWFESSRDGEAAVRKQSLFLNYAIASAALVVVISQSPWLRKSDRSLLDSGTPIGAVDYIERHALQGNIYHPQVYGDYLIWRLWPRQHSFFDGRVHLFGESFVSFYRKLQDDPHWGKMLFPYKIRYLLLAKTSGSAAETRMLLDARASSDWIMLYEDRHTALFEMRSRPKT